MNMIQKRMEMRGQGGFTLIELLVVVAILAILAGVAVFAVSNLTQDADANACKVEADTIKTAHAAARATSSTTDTTGVYLDGAPKYFNVSNAMPPVVTANGTLPTGCSIPTIN